MLGYFFLRAKQLQPYDSCPFVQSGNFKGIILVQEFRLEKCQQTPMFYIYPSTSTPDHLQTVETVKINFKKPYPEWNINKLHQRGEGNVAKHCTAICVGETSPSQQTSALPNQWRKSCARPLTRLGCCNHGQADAAAHRRQASF